MCVCGSGRVYLGSVLSKWPARHTEGGQDHLWRGSRGLTHTHVFPWVPVSFPKSSSVLQGKGAFVCRHLSEKVFVQKEMCCIGGS